MAQHVHCQGINLKRNFYGTSYRSTPLCRKTELSVSASQVLWFPPVNHLSFNGAPLDLIQIKVNDYPGFLIGTLPVISFGT